ncbi:TRAP transporter substrate-binding protein [Ruicaihuangia caeni]|uniref:TRAP transporter substrate-binding protein n=1 Tax=Ruicaihuangia caeni TaxID=3042517 RepID=A0AAW6TCY3_9MICO|nr:TRAP transporter substrate-binding protein [Klugiella sp. YN-L-19]MDI2098927.1 TRAP transporter substrate-binding protein [Klugiella sp. YN-L-19]
MKKTVIALGLASALALTGCAASEGGKSDGDSGDAPSFDIRVAHQIAPDTPLQEGALKFKELVEERSDGRITVSVYPSAQLGNELDTIAQVQADSLEVALVSPAVMSNVAPNAAVWSMPYLIDGDSEEEQYENLKKVAQIDEVEQMTEDMAAEYGMRAVDWTWWYGNRHITNSVRPIESVDDLKGMKLRTPDAPIHFLAIEDLGASPSPMAFSELYLALQTGAVDGQENPFSTIESGKFFEVQKYLAVTGHLTQGEVALFSEAFWQRLSDEDRELIETAIKDAGEHQSQLALEENAAALERLESEHGMTVTRPDLKSIREATKGSAEKWAAANSGFSIDIYNAIIESQK